MEHYTVEFFARTTVLAESVEDAKRQVFRGMIDEFDVLEIEEAYEEED